MKLYSDLSLNSNDLFEIKTLQLIPITGSSYDSSSDTLITTPIGTIYLDSNITADTVTDSDISTVPANLAKIGLKLKYRQFADGDASTTDDGKFNWLSILGGYLAKEGTGVSQIFIKRYNLDGGRLLNANTTPRFASELVCKSYVDSRTPVYTFNCTFTVGTGTDTDTHKYVATGTTTLTYIAANTVHTASIYERSGTTNGYEYVMVLADIKIVVESASIVNTITVTFAVAPTLGTDFELRGA